MPRYRIVIKDADVAHAQEIERNVRANMLAHRLPRERVEKAVRDVVGPKRAKGDVHAELDSECPDGRPNCRNCGDPQHAETCRAEGHCPHCGTRHGIAPTRVLEANGYELETV